MRQAINQFRLIHSFMTPFVAIQFSPFLVTNCDNNEENSEMSMTATLTKIDDNQIGVINTKVIDRLSKLFTFNNNKEKQQSKNLIYNAIELEENKEVLDNYSRRHNNKIGTYTVSGVDKFQAKINQDRAIISIPYNNNFDAMAAVYDGHGFMGETVSQFVMEEVNRQLQHHPLLNENPLLALEDTFVVVNDQLKKSLESIKITGGTTANLILVRDGMLYSSNVGDSRSVIGYSNGSGFRYMNLTKDQKPDLPEEKARIEEAGGFVAPIFRGQPARVWSNDHKVGLGLAVSRSIGDFALQNFGVIPMPQVNQYSFKSEKQNDELAFLILATDGVWDVFTSKEAVELVGASISDHHSGSIACRELIKISKERWTMMGESYRDDITAIVIIL